MAGPVTRVGFAGLGAMGTGMATNIQKWLASEAALPHLRGSQLMLYNRNTSKATELAASIGAEVAATPADLASASVVFSMLSNDAAVEQVFSAYLQGLEKQAAAASAPIFVDCSTVLPASTKRLAVLAAERGAAYLACPVFGRPDAAAAGMLIGVLSGGTAEQRETVKAIIGGSFAGRRIIDLGDELGAAHAMKLAGNMWIASQIEVAAETLTLAEKNGVPPDVMASLLEGMTAAGIPVGYTKRIAAGDYSAETGFAVELGLKDVGHMRSLGRDSACPVPIADLVFNHLLTRKARGDGALDWGSAALTMREAAGLPPNTKEKHS